MNPTSRRERPAKPALTRQGIVEAALAILREDGLDRVTMKRIATALDTGPASLYVYVRNTEDLHAQILDELLASIRVDGFVDGDWRTGVASVLRQYLRLLIQHPQIARMAMSTQPSGPHYLALVEGILALLQAGGIADREAAWAVDLLLLLATANAVEHSSPDDKHGTNADGLTAALLQATTNPDTYPQIARHGDDLLSGPGADRFTWSIHVILAGALTAKRPHSVAH